MSCTVHERARSDGHGAGSLCRASPLGVVAMVDADGWLLGAARESGESPWSQPTGMTSSTPTRTGTRDRRSWR
jgi:hypothetical protein